MTNRKLRIVTRCIAFAVMASGVGALLGAQTPSTPSAAVPAAPTTDWKNYSYAEDGFSASFPSAPEFSKRDVPTEKGSFELRSYLVEFEPVALFAGVCDYGSAIAGMDTEKVLHGAEDGALKNSNSHLISDKKTTFGVYHALTFEAESDTAHFSARIYLVGSTLYQTLVVYPIGKPYDGASRFLDSFQLIARVAK
ncbi:MAG: hypothetical protein ABR905_13610 [Terracidiphilus sp.]|jgi:hypothetical protein